MTPLEESLDELQSINWWPEGEGNREILQMLVKAVLVIIDTLQEIKGEQSK